MNQKHSYGDDLSSLYKAWEDYYDKKGLGANKARALTFKKVSLRKSPPQNN